MNSFVKIIGLTAVLTTVAFGVSISSVAMWLIVSGQYGDGRVTINAVTGVAFLFTGFVMAGWVEKRSTMEQSK